MKKSRWIDPYSKNSKGVLVPSVKDCWTCAQAGVYLIRHIQTGNIVYVGSSSTQLKKTIYRHFQTWNDKKQPRIVYPKTGYYQIRFIKCTAAQAAKMEKALIDKYQPKDNPLKYSEVFESEKKQGIKLYKKALISPFLQKDDYITEDIEVPF